MNKDNKSQSSANNTPQTTPQISRRRLWLFRIISAVVVPVVLLLLPEIILRVAGFGFSPSAFVKYRFKGRTVYSSNNKFGWSFFPPEFTRRFEPFVVPADKTDNTYRIFILGESAAWGDPDPSYCFGRQLSVMLGQQFPSVNFEVYTAAMAAINSHVIVRIAKDCARLKPDLFVVYMGNNEVVGPYGAGTVFAPLSKSLPLIRMGIAIKTTRVGQLMTRLFGIMGKGPEIRGGLKMMFLGKQIRHDDNQMPYVYSHFRHNLEDIIRIAQKSDDKIIVSTVAVNLKDFPPFASMHQPGLNEQQKQQFDEFYRKGILLEDSNDFEGATGSYLAASEIDDTYAELQFRLGRCLWNLRQYDRAKERYARSMELDTLRFRADATINRIIREVSQNRESQGVYLVDAAEEFARQSPHNCPGFELFFDHVHPIFSGNYLLAKTVFDQVEQILPDKIKVQKDTDALFPSEQVCAKHLAFTVYDDIRVSKLNLGTLSNRQPFINRAYQEETVNFWRQKVERLNTEINPAALAGALEQYEQAIKLNSTDRYLRLNYSKLLLNDGKNVYAAAEQCRQIIEQTPYDFHTLLALANMEVQVGNINSALEHAILATKYMPADPVANHITGTLYQKTGQYEKAQRYIAEVIKLNPKAVSGYINLAWLLSHQGKIRQAEKVYRKGIAAVPDDASLHLYLSVLLRHNGQLKKAENQLRKAISLDPKIVSSPMSTLGPMK